MKPLFFGCLNFPLFGFLNVKKLLNVIFESVYLILNAWPICTVLLLYDILSCSFDFKYLICLYCFLINGNALYV